ncbi:hypothetical protein CVT24_003802 [Panaeolus cyanescens]|uniref:F-box domain-containing protein n=1 Tax=Panaeolus cyanescens TaxID=181874 RepID=A0A409VUV4_9AGAR|nr:hypothetical protein CVT24_003802 [Panaeolus cyanescens]
MQTVLQNDFMLSEIMQFLELDRSAGYAAALTCRAFRNPAQNVLWRHLATVFPLLKLLSNLKPRKEADSNDIVWFLEDQITSQDVERLKVFGTRVRSISSKWFRKEIPSQEQIDDSVFVAVASALQSHSLVPNLRSLNMLLGRKKGCHPSAVLQLLYSPYIQDIYLRSGDGPNLTLESFLPADDIAVYLKVLSRLHARSLRTLDLYDFPSELNVLESIPFLQGLSTLRLANQEQVVLEQSAITALAQLPHLDSLKLEVHHIIWNGSSRDIVPFNTLIRLEVSCQFMDVVELFSRFKFPSLQKLQHQLILRQQPHAHLYPWDRYFNAVGSSTASPFCDLSVERWLRGQEERRRWKEFRMNYEGVVFDYIKQSLLTLKHRLRRLWVSFPLVSSLSIENLEEIASMWPNMQELSIRAVSPVILNTSSLRLIALKFPHLQALFLDIDCTLIASPRKGSSHRLHSLFLQLSNWGGTEMEVHELVMLVDSLFPHLMNLRNMDAPILEDILDEERARYQSIRRLERHRLGVYEDGDNIKRFLSVDVDSGDDSDAMEVE